MIRKPTFRSPSTVIAAAAVAAIAMAAPEVRAETPAEFYQGKSINMYVGVSAGGIYSTFALILARHMNRHIPGRPSIVVQHMPGAGGTRAVEYAYDVAPKDGTALLTPNAGVALRVLLGINSPAYDPNRFTWLGGWGEAVNTISLLKDHTRVRTLEDAKKTEVLLGSIGKSSNTYMIPALMSSTLGTKFRMITGYRGGAPIRLAIERGEVYGWAGQWDGWKLAKPDWVKEGRLVHLVQLASKPAADLPNVRLLSSYAETAEERQMFQAVQSGIADRALVVPPGVPADRVTALRTAYQETLRDPAFVREANSKAFEIDPIPGDTIQRFVSELMATPQPVVARMKRAMGL